VTRAVRFISGRSIRKPRPKISCCGAPVSRDFLFFDGAVDVSKVIAKGVTGIGCSLLEVTGEVQLCAQRPAGLNSCRLSPFRFPNVPGGYKQLFNIFRPDEKAAVVICENEITRLHLEIAEAGMPER
jgi:hypothetical protein